MKKWLSLLLASVLAVSMLAGCGGGSDAPAADDGDAAGDEGGKVYKVCNLVNGNLGDKSFFDSAEAGLQELLARGLLAEEDVRAADPEDFLKFGRSALAERMRRAKERGELYREQPFVIGLPGKEADGSDTEELVLIQGIIDAFFYEENEIVLLDYKTDRVRSAGELSEKYRPQLEYYARALTMMTGKRVKEKLIYSFALGEAVSVWISRMTISPQRICSSTSRMPSISHSCSMHSLVVSRMRGWSFSRTTCSSISALRSRCIHRGWRPVPLAPIIRALPQL